VTERDIFTAAREMADPAARSAYLDRACDGDAGMRARVEALLRAHDQPDSLLDHPAVSRPEPGYGPTQAFSAPDSGRESNEPAEEEVPLGFLEPPTRPDAMGRLGHYEMLQVLGKGGFGIVFRAFDETLQRVVAVKVMAPQIAMLSPARKRFVREARSSAAVRHENVVQIYEVGERPLPYLAMEFIPGETLQQRLNRSGPLDVPEVLRIGRQVAEGLAAAHACDLIHRDIKPGNILLEGGSHKAKITDFGLARAADDASISQSGVVAGTPMFMAPEQAQGQSLDQRADLFSFGSVLYQMVSGRAPFRANSTVAVLKRVVEDTPRAIREIIPETPQWLCDIIAKLHAKKPDERFQSAREIADVLADCEAKLKAKQQVKNILPAVMPARRKWVAAAAVLVLAVIALAVTEFVGATHLFRVRQAATDPNLAGFEGAPDRVTKQESPAPASVSPPPLEKAGPRKLAEVMDLTTARVLVADDFSDPSTSAFGWGNWALRFKDGRIVMDGTLAPSWGDTGHQFSDFVCEVVARTSRDSHKGWGLHLHKEFDKDTPDARFGGVEVMLNSQGELSVLSGRWGQRKVAGLPSVGPFRVAVYNQDEFNSLVVVFRGGRHLEVFVNSVEACQPITLPCVLEPAHVHLASMGGVSGAARLEFKSYKVWSAPPTPVPVVKQEPPPTFTNSVGMEFVIVPKGKSWLGGDKDKLGDQEVEIPADFYLGKYEVTQEEWEKVMGENPSFFSRTGQGKDALEAIPDAELKRFPVENVSWDQCQLFVAKLNQREKETGWVYRLPKLAEWEYACRGGPMSGKMDSGFDFYFFKPTNTLLPERANFDRGFNRPIKVGSYEPNRLGLFDMSGNVAEWCDDIRKGEGPNRYLRGGCFLDEARKCRAQLIDMWQASLKGNTVGLRLARVPAGASLPEAKTAPQDPDRRAPE
jgi:formylglycine-generating enzyme required for sulfatase activity